MLIHLRHVTNELLRETLQIQWLLVRTTWVDLFDSSCVLAPAEAVNGLLSAVAESQHVVDFEQRGRAEVFCIMTISPVTLHGLWNDRSSRQAVAIPTIDRNSPNWRHFAVLPSLRMHQQIGLAWFLASGLHRRSGTKFCHPISIH